MKDDTSSCADSAHRVTLAAIERVLAPLVRLALRVGLKYQDLDLALKRTFVQEAGKALHADGTAARVSASRISVATGLHRKQLRGAALAPTLARRPASRALAARRTLASQVFTRWVDELDAHPERVSLPTTAATASLPSFADLTACTVTDVHYRAVLDELVRLGLVEEADGMVHLLGDRFAPRRSTADRVAVPMENAQSMLATIVDNVTDAAPHRLEHAIAGAGISRADCDRLDALASEAWARAYRDFYQAILDTPEAPVGEPRYRLRIGMYVNAEPLEDNGAEQ